MKSKEQPQSDALIYLMCAIFGLAWALAIFRFHCLKEEGGWMVHTFLLIAICGLVSTLRKPKSTIERGVPFDDPKNYNPNDEIGAAS
jgi:hypothetical protein